MTGTARGTFTDDLALQALALPNLPSPTQGVALIKQSLTPTAVAGDTTVEQSFTVAGLLAGDWVEITPPALTAGVLLGNARVSAANTLQVQFVNSTSGSLTPPAGVHSILVVR